MAVGLALAFGGFVPTGPAAMAGSRFEAGDTAPARAAVRMDFTVVIPEMLTLTIASRAQDADNAKLKWSLPVPALQPERDDGTSGGTVLPVAVATGNAGTLAIGANPHSITSRREADTELSEKVNAPQPSATLAPSAHSVSLDTHHAIFLIAIP